MSKIEDCICCDISDDDISFGLVGKAVSSSKSDKEMDMRNFLRENGVRISSAYLDRDGLTSIFSFATLFPLDFLEDSTKNKIKNQINTYEIGNTLNYRGGNLRCQN